ncbi:hypothetical protein AVEN_214941-2-1, partial [Araneus ventricosus]
SPDLIKSSEPKFQTKQSNGTSLTPVQPASQDYLSADQQRRDPELAICELVQSAQPAACEDKSFYKWIRCRLSPVIKHPSLNLQYRRSALIHDVQSIDVRND